MRIKDLAKRGLSAVGIRSMRQFWFFPYRGEPTDREQVDREYRTGQWDSLKTLAELPRYYVIAGYCERFRPMPAVLDIGCGEGFLQQALGRYTAYVGLDLSGEAIARARGREDERTRFVQGDVYAFTPDRRFDAVVFNESLFYMRDPIAALRRFDGALEPGGVFIVSIYEMGLDRRIWKMLRADYETIAGVRLEDEERLSWIVRVLRPRSGQVPAGG